MLKLTVLKCEGREKSGPSFVFVWMNVYMFAWVKGTIEFAAQSILFIEKIVIDDADVAHIDFIRLPF